MRHGLGDGHCYNVKDLVISSSDTNWPQSGRDSEQPTIPKISRQRVLYAGLSFSDNKHVVVVYVGCVLER